MAAKAMNRVNAKSFKSLNYRINTVSHSAS